MASCTSRPDAVRQVRKLLDALSDGERSAWRERLAAVTRELQAYPQHWARHLDREVKLPLYAAAGIREVWIVDSERRTVDSYRRPSKDVYLARHRASLGGATIVTLYLQEKHGWRAGKVQLVIDCTVVLLALFVVEPARVGWSVLGAVVMGLFLWVNHRPGRYMAM